MQLRIPTCRSGSSWAARCLFAWRSYRCICGAIIAGRWTVNGDGMADQLQTSWAEAAIWRKLTMPWGSSSMLGITSSKCTVSRANLTFPRGRSNFRLAPRCSREINARTMLLMLEESNCVTSVRLTNILSVPSSISCGRSSNASQPHYFSQTLQRKRDTTAEVGQSRQWRSATSVYSC